MGRKIIFGQGDEQPEFSWLDKAEWDLAKAEWDLEEMLRYIPRTKENIQQAIDYIKAKKS